MENNVIAIERGSNELILAEIRGLVKTIYDIQKLRIAVVGRVIALFYGSLENSEVIVEKKTPSKEKKKIIACLALREQAQNDEDAYDMLWEQIIEKLPKLKGDLSAITEYLDKEEEKILEGKEKEKEEILKKLRTEYKRITDAIVATNSSVMKYLLNSSGDIEYMKTEALYNFFSYYNSLVETEAKMGCGLEKIVQQHPMWNAFFRDVRGCGALMSGVILSYFDIYKARHVSSFYKYAGMDVVIKVDDETGEMRGEGRGKKHARENLVDYIDAAGDVKQKASLGYNPFLKAKLLGVLGGGFLRNKSQYAKIYYDYKFRLNNAPEHKDKIPAHKNRMAIRYMVKQFIRDCWVAWRTVEGLEVSDPYEVAVLHRNPHGTDPGRIEE